MYKTTPKIQDPTTYPLLLIDICARMSYIFINITKQLYAQDYLQKSLYFSKWKKTQIDGNAPIVNKVVDFISTSIYVNPKSERQRLVKPHVTTDRWHQYLQQGLETFSINEEPFQFGMMVNLIANLLKT